MFYSEESILYDVLPIYVLLIEEEGNHASGSYLVNFTVVTNVAFQRTVPAEFLGMQQTSEKKRGSKASSF